MSNRLARRVVRSQRAVLQRIYGFDRWHVGHSGEPYVQDIVDALNRWPEPSRDAVVEIGCGLGDIVRRLRFRRRVGLDRDSGALAAARFLSRFSTVAPPVFEPFEFPGSPLHGVYNAIIMVNWIHQVDPETLAGALREYAAHHLRPGGAVVLDTVDDAAYEHNHDVAALAWPGASIAELGRYARGRHVWMFR